MKRILTKTFALCAALAVSASFAIAETNAKPDVATNNMLSGKLMKASDVVGAKLFNEKGEEIGKINDVVFDENTGSMTHGILSIGGWLGIGDTLTPVPWKFVHQSKKDTQGFVVEVDKAKLHDATGFNQTTWPSMNDSWYKDTYVHYGLTGTHDAKLVRASTVIDAKLFNEKGEHVGEITNVLMHPNSGKIAYATLAIGEYVGQGDKLTNVPWNLIRQSKKDTPGFVVKADKMKLQGAKYFEPNSRPNYGDVTWQKNVYAYYGSEPYWTHPVIN